MAFLEQLERHGRDISQRILDEMYRDPFWSERYGARGRRHADEDSDFHLQYLRRALEAGDCGVMERYARWLRGVLNARGMCTRHLDENFERLARALSDEGWEGHAEAVACIEAARAALQHAQAPARELQAAVTAIAQRACEQFRREHRALSLLRGPEGLRDDFETVISYLADAIDSGEPASFLAYLRWLGASLDRNGAPRGILPAVVDAVTQALVGTRLDAPARRVLDAAREALA